ncbi:MAG: HAD family phosphatase [bacterium]|nr:HAD family phosphatase [Candidatus Minthenecus merdequi]
MRYKNYIFDQGNVILNINPQLSLDAFSQILPDSAENSAPITAADLLGGAVGTIVGDFQVGRITTEHFIDKLLPSMRLGVTRKQLLDAWNALILDVPQQRRDALLRLRASGARTYMLSNTNDAHMERIYEKCFGGCRDNMLEYFDDLFLSNEMHLAKPDPEIFNELICRTGINPAESIFVDDLQKNLDTASALGFHTLLSTGDYWIHKLFENY